MNKYQKQINKETKNFIKDHKSKNTFRNTRQMLKNNDSGNEFTLCNCCSNIMCNKSKNKIFYCKGWE